MVRKKILIIDDEPDLCELMKLNLESSGEFEVTTAYSGPEGLEKAGKTSFDLVITDYRMPGMDGKEVLDNLEKMEPNPPVILFSIYHDDNSVITDSIKHKADGLISKPIDTKQLYDIIKHLLAKKSPK